MLLFSNMLKENISMSFRIKKRMCFLLILFLIFLVFLPWNLQERKQPEGETVKKEEILTYHRLGEVLIKEWSQEERTEKERVVNVYLGIESQAYFEKHHVYLSGKAKRQVRRKLERMYDQGKLKLANLN